MNETRVQYGTNAASFPNVRNKMFATRGYTPVKVMFIVREQ